VPPSGNITYQSITFNTTGVLAGTNTPIANPNQPGYETYYFKVMLHELGHVFGLADYYPPGPCNQSAAQTVVSQLCGVNDIQQGLPLAITQCDKDAVQSWYATQPIQGGSGPGCGHTSVKYVSSGWDSVCYREYNTYYYYYCGVFQYHVGPFIVYEWCLG
jgi:hypothetical protein